MKLIAQLENFTVEIYCNTWSSVYVTIETWRDNQYYFPDVTNHPNKIIPYHSVKFFTVKNDD